MQETILLDERRDEGQEEPVSGLHNNSSFHDLESFLESVLVPSPVSISAELVPSVLARGLGLATYSESLGQQGSNDRRSGRPRSSVSNGDGGVQGNTNNNNTATVIGATGGSGVPGGVGIVGAPAGTAAIGGAGPVPVVGAIGTVGAPKVRFELLDTIHCKEEAKNNLMTMSHHRQPNVQSNQIPEVGDLKAFRAEERRRQKTRKRDNNSAAGGTSRKKKTKENDKLGSPGTNAFSLPSLPPPGGVGPQMPAQYVFGVPQMGLPSQMAPQQLQQMQQQLQQQMQQQMQMSQLGLGQFPQPYMYAAPVQLPDGRIAGFYPGMDQFPVVDNVEKDADHTVKRSRLVWTSELHKKFLDAVERCGGIEHALPKAIMNDMKVVGLTRENVSSHLQKYRIRVKETERIEQREDEGGCGGAKGGE